MKFRHGHRKARAIRRRIPHRELGLQMLPLIEQLAFGLCNLFASKLFCANPATIKLITAPHRFFVNHREIAGNRRNRIPRRLKTMQLRVMPIPARLPLQNLLRQQPLPPERYKPFRVEMFGM